MNEHPTNQNEHPDPFGRLMSDDGSQENFRDLADIFDISSPVGPTDQNLPDDVARVEIIMDHIGELDLKQTDGPTGFYGERLRQAIVAVQKRAGLPETGRLAPSDTTMTAVKQLVNAQSAHPEMRASGMAQEATELMPATPPKFFQH